MEAAQRFLEARKRFLVGSENWAWATAWAFIMLSQEECAEVAKPEWLSDEGLKALSARVVRAAPDNVEANAMRAMVLSGKSAAWAAGPRSAAELREAAAHFERAAALLRRRKPSSPVMRHGAASRHSGLLADPPGSAGLRARARARMCVTFVTLERACACVDFATSSMLQR